MTRIVFAFFILCGFLWHTPAFSAITSKPFAGGIFDPGPRAVRPQTGKEGILLSFYRNSGKIPDFKRWSQLTDTAKKAATYDRRVVALNEQVRLQTAFENTDPGGLLVIHAPIDVSRYSETQEVLFLHDFSHGGTLTQNVYNEKIAMVIPDLKRFEALSIPNVHAGAFFRPLTEGGRKKEITVPVIAEMVVKPRRTILSKENRIGQNDHFLFYLDLAQITIWKAEEPIDNYEPLWTWRADWYKPQTNNDDLLQLYKAIN